MDVEKVKNLIKEISKLDENEFDFFFELYETTFFEKNGYRIVLEPLDG